MFGIHPWLVLAVVFSIGVLVYAWLRLRQRDWIYRILLVLGFLCLIWGVMPIFGGGGLQQFLVVGAIAAFGFLILSGTTPDDLSG